MNCVVTKHNFFEKLPNIKRSLSKADFIAIDAKFTGNPSITQHKQSSYVTAEEQYLSVSQDIDEFLIIQFDITAFTFKKKENTYSACTYVFYLYRRYVPTLKSRVTFQYSALSSLCDKDFAFNKCFTEGVTYLNEPEQEQLHRDLLVYSMLPPRRRTEGFYLGVDRDTQQVIDSVCVTIYLWFKSENIDPLVVNDIDYDDKLLVHIVLKEINMRFGNVWACYDKSDKIVINKVTDYARGKDEVAVEKDSTFEKKFANCCVGFSHIFKFLTTLKKPIVGHDILVTLISMCNQFHTPLPNTYDEFKCILHSILPFIYDTRFIVCQLQDQIKNARLWESNELGHLYQYFVENGAILADSNSPTVKHLGVFDDESIPNRKMFKENEGYKLSYQVGYCFIKMMHILATHNNSTSGADEKLLTFKEHLSAIVAFKNCVYISLANISHMCLEGPDPQSDRHHWLLVKPSKDKTVIDSSLLEQSCTASCTNVIVRRVSNDQVLIGTDTQAGMRRLLEVLNATQSYETAAYKDTESVSTMSPLIWPSVALLCSALGAWIVYKICR